MNLARDKNGKIELNAYDELFMDDEERKLLHSPRILDIPINLIDDFPEHPFKVKDDEDMMNLVESIKERGVITPATVRDMKNGRYQMVSGHRRKRASELAGLDTLRCEVVEMDKDAATILMVESNYQRSTILPSEKAFAYKMRMEALTNQGKRNDLTSDPVEPKLRANETVSHEMGDSVSQIKRYVRLTHLVPELLELVDEGRIKMRPAVELSYLDEDSQREVVDQIDLQDCTPSHDQAIRMRKAMQEGDLSPDDIMLIMCEQKPNQRERVVLSVDKIGKYIPLRLPLNKREEYIVKALEYYAQHQKEIREQENER